MFGKKKVLVSGAGPVGLTTALALSEKGQPVMVIDKEDGPGTHSYGLALHPETLELMSMLGIVEDILESAYKVNRIIIHRDSDKEVILDFNKAGSIFPFVAVVRQCDLEYILIQALKERDVSVLWNHRLATLQQKQDTVKATIQKMEMQLHGYAAARLDWVVDKEINIDARYIVGADGHLSLIRRLLGFEFKAVKEAQQFAVFECSSDVDLDHAMHIMLHDESTSALWPLPDGQLRWSFQIDDRLDLSESRIKDRHLVQLGLAGYPSLTEEMLHELIKERAPWFASEIEEIKWQLAVRFESRLASSFGKGRVWLAGDAAHMTGPVGIQSMNIGILEGNELAGILATPEIKDYPEDYLDDYIDQRNKEWRPLLGLETNWQATENTPTSFIDSFSRLIACLPASRDTFDNLVNQLGFEKKCV